MASRLGRRSVGSVCVFCRQLRPLSRTVQPRPGPSTWPAAPVRHLSSTSPRPHPSSGIRSTSQQPTYYSLFPQTYPDGPPPAGKFSGSPRSLRAEFLKLQQVHHPDLQSQAPAAAAASASSAGNKSSTSGDGGAEDRTSAYINNAYRTLLDPLSRAEYVLELQGVESRGEADKIDGGEFLMSVMEITEVIEDDDNPLSSEEVELMKQENDKRKGECVLEIEDLFTQAKWAEAKESVIRLRYWEMVGKRIAEKL